MCILVATVSTRRSLRSAARSLRSAARGDHLVPRTRVKFRNQALAVAGPETWNSLPVDIWSSDTVIAFKNSLKDISVSTVILHRVVMIYLTLKGALEMTHSTFGALQVGILLLLHCAQRIVIGPVCGCVADVQAARGRCLLP